MNNWEPAVARESFVLAQRMVVGAQLPAKFTDNQLNANVSAVYGHNLSHVWGFRANDWAGVN